MAIDTSIPMQGIAIDTATPIRQGQQMQMQEQEQQNRNAMAAQKVLGQHYQNMNAREKSRLTSTIAGAAQLNTFLQNNDLEGAHNFLQNRRQTIASRMAAGEDVDTQETDAALQMIQTGNVQELQNNVQGLLAAGQVYGMVNTSDQPANVREWQYFNSLSNEDKQRYLQMKRSNQLVNLGGTQKVIGAGGETLADFEVTPKPEQQPDFQRQQEQAKTEGRSEGEKQANFGKAQQALNNLKAQSQLVTSTIDKALDTISPWSTGFGVALARLPNTQARELNNYLTTIKANIGFDKLQSMRDASPTGGALGQVSEMENRLLQAVNGALDPMQENQLVQNLQVIRETYPRILAEREQAFVSDYGDRATPSIQQPQTQRVRVSNPQTGETFEIEAGDLQAAQAEGFVQQ